MKFIIYNKSNKKLNFNNLLTKEKTRKYKKVVKVNLDGLSIENYCLNLLADDNPPEDHYGWDNPVHFLVNELSESNDFLINGELYGVYENPFTKQNS